MTVRTKEEWRKLFLQCATDKEMFVMVLENINGYGTEYGYEVDDDADDLSDAFEAMKSLPPTLELKVAKCDPKDFIGLPFPD